MKITGQISLFGVRQPKFSLPTEYEPKRPDYMNVSRIYLTRGSLATPERRKFVERICLLYPESSIIEQLEIPHNRLDLHVTDDLTLHQMGKKTLVFGELQTAVRYSKEEGNTCPNYWHFSPYGFCPYGCKYCYLAGTQGVKFSPSVKIYVNLPEILEEIDRTAECIKIPVAFYLGKLQDALALDPLTAYSTILVPFFAEHPYARLILLTKSICVDRLMKLEHKGHTILSWSVNPPEICQMFEENTPEVYARLEAMKRVASVGYPVRAVMMPVIPVDGWREIYTGFTRFLLKSVPVQRLTIGGICIYQGARNLMEKKMGLQNSISTHIENTSQKAGDGRARYSRTLRKDLYSCIIESARELRPDLEIALCLEEKELWQEFGIESQLGRCNCVL
jgi:spore photoproduct lyase